MYFYSKTQNFSIDLYFYLATNQFSFVQLMIGSNDNKDDNQGEDDNGNDGGDNGDASCNYDAYCAIVDCSKAEAQTLCPEQCPGNYIATI